MACLSAAGIRLSETYLIKKTMNDLSSASASASSLCLRSDINLTRRRRVNNNNNSNNNNGMKLAAMAVQGGGKYKGTQMREKLLTEMIEKKVMEAKEVCQGGDPVTDECKVAWDEVEEVSQAKADLRLKLERRKDPLESFCHDNPETDECRIYQD